MSVPNVEQLLEDVSNSERIIDWDEFFLVMCFVMARKSKDPSTKTGCVVVRDRRVLSTGYNGFPIGVADTPERYNDRPTKYQMVVHCDTNAIYSAAKNGISLNGATMYLTGPPCNECTKGIIQAGIVEVVWPKKNKFEDDADTARRWDNSLNNAFTMLAEARVKVRRWE